MARKSRKRSAGAARVDMLVAGALVLASLILRLALQNDGLFHHDSVCLAQAVEATRETGHLQPVLLHDPPVAGRYGLVLVNTVLYTVGSAIFGVNLAEPVLLFSAALFGALAVGMLFLMGRELGLTGAASAAGAILLSLSPVYFSETVGAKDHGLALFLVLSGFWLALRAARLGSAGAAAAAGLLMGAAGFVRVAVLLALPPAGLMLLFQSAKCRQRALPAFLVTAVAAIALLLLVQWEWITQLATVTGYSGWDSRVVGLAERDLLYSWTPVGIVLVAIGLVATRSERRAWWLFLWGVLVFLYVANLQQYSPRFLIEALAAGSVLIAAGLYSLVGRWQPAFWLVALALAIVPFVRTWKVIAYRHDRIGNKEVALVVKEKTPENAVVIAMDDSPFIQYYGDRQTMNHPISGDVEEVKAFAQSVGNLLVQGRTVYILATGFSYDPDGLVRKVLGQNFDLAAIARIESEDYHHASIQSRLYEQVLYEIRLRPISERGRS